MASQVTVTGKIGPGVAVTAQVFTGVTQFGIATADQKLFIQQGGNPVYVDINGKTTITVSVSGGSYTVSVS